MSTLWRKSVQITIAFLLLFYILTAYESPSLSQTPEPPSQKIIVGGDNNYPPYEFMNEYGNPTGFNIELLEAIARVEGLSLDIQLGPWNDVRQKLENREIDMLSGMYYSQERDLHADFSKPHSWNIPGIFIRRGSDLHSMEELDGHQILVQQGDIMHDYLRAQPGVTIVPAADPIEALKILSSGQYDAALLSSEAQGYYAIQHYKLTNLTSLTLTSVPQSYCFAVQEGNTELLQKLNEGLEIVKKNGEYEEIYNRWLGIERPRDLNHLIQDYLWLAIIIIIVLSGGLLWNWRLQKRFRRQTRELHQTEALQRRRNEELALLNRVISTASSTLVSEKVLQVLCDELALALHLPRVTAALIRPEKRCAMIVAEHCAPGYPSSRNLAIPLDSPATALLIRYKQPLLIANPQNDPRLQNLYEEIRRLGICTMLLMPLVVRGRTIGTLGLDSSTPRLYNEDDMNLLRSATAAAGQALEAAQLYQELQKRAEVLEITISQRTAELREALEQAQAADRAKSEFVSNVNHELRTPLTSIKLYLNLLEKAPPHKYHQYLTSIQREADRLQNLIENLLQISRVDLGQIKPQFQNLEVPHLLETLVADRHALVSSRGLNLSLETRENLPPVQADPKLLEQVVTNLLTNALNYTPGGGQIWLQANKIEREGHAWITIAVKDTGMGISLEEQSRLFQRFQRGEASQQMEVPGTGLGLAISKALVEMHNGHITLESAPGQGSTFTIWLPLSMVPTV